CRCGGVIAALALFVMSLTTTYEVIMRYVFNRPTTWVHETGASLVVVIGMLGAAYVLLHDNHVRADLILVRVPRQTQSWLDLATSAVALAFFFALLTYFGWRMSVAAAPHNSTPVFGITVLRYGWAYWLVPVGALLVCLQLISRMYRNLMWLRGKRESMVKEGAWLEVGPPPEKAL
ncbi:MAG: TRAP transporter small permease, partial [Dehalococcoidia bacterium]|nr:TRAP transporter small permease [Dehalococcoidia bacterium]